MKYIQVAIKRAQASQCRYRLGAVVAVGGRVVSSATNKKRNNPAIDFTNATFHAEEAALRRLRSSKGGVIYVARIDSKGKAALARPCMRCQELLSSAGITKAYYTIDDETVGYLALTS
ncbi:hypothetical protein [Streptomyces djakartensis]|uniref:hypothetical protein n=1 Tax=Streptomyces djakartensis TaxID=68193 RepID=UPI0034DF151C